MKPGIIHVLGDDPSRIKPSFNNIEIMRVQDEAMDQKFGNMDSDQTFGPISRPLHNSWPRYTKEKYRIENLISKFSISDKILAYDDKT